MRPPWEAVADDSSGLSVHPALPGGQVLDLPAAVLAGRDTSARLGLGLVDLDDAISPQPMSPQPCGPRAGEDALVYVAVRVVRVGQFVVEELAVVAGTRSSMGAPRSAPGWWHQVLVTDVPASASSRASWRLKGGLSCGAAP